jgi:hypothetical protein
VQKLTKGADDKAAQLRHFPYDPLLSQPAVACFRACLLCPSPQLV